MKNVVLIGASLNCGNLGVNALTRGSITALLDEYSDLKITILSYNLRNEKKNIIKYDNSIIEINEVPINMNLKKQILAVCTCTLLKFMKKKPFMNKINKNYKYIEESDVIFDLTAGDSFSDIYGMRRYLDQSWVKLVAILNKKKVYLLPQTMGPFNNRLVKLLTKFIVNNVNFNFTRDHMSYDLLVEEFNVDKNKVMCIPDMAFYMKPDKSVSLENAINKKIEGIKVGINISALLFHGGYNQDNMFSLKEDYSKLIDKVINNFMSKENVSIILIPHVITEEFPVEDDLSVCKKIYEDKLDQGYKNIYFVDNSYNEAQIKSIISQCDFFIGSRMHACIAALSSGVPNVPMAYSKKFIGIWKDFGLEECIADLRFDDEKTVISKINGNFMQRLDKKKKIDTNIKYVEKQIRNLFLEVNLD